jgi:hypothetical protein
MHKVSVAVDALDKLLSALEGIGRFAGLVRTVQSSVKKSIEETSPAQIGEKAANVVIERAEVLLDNAVNQVGDLVVEKKDNLVDIARQEATEVFTDSVSNFLRKK